MRELTKNFREFWRHRGGEITKLARNGKVIYFDTRSEQISELCLTLKTTVFASELNYIIYECKKNTGNTSKGKM